MAFVALLPFTPDGWYCLSWWLYLFCTAHTIVHYYWLDQIVLLYSYVFVFSLLFGEHFWDKQILDTHKEVGIHLLTNWLLLAAEGSWRHTDKTCNVCGFSSQLPTLSKPQRHSLWMPADLWHTRNLFLPKLFNFQSTLSSPSILQVTGYKKGSTIRETSAATNRSSEIEQKERYATMWRRQESHGSFVLLTIDHNNS